MKNIIIVLFVLFTFLACEKEITIDEMFEKYSNGYPSISLTIYNDDKGNELPIFMASNIYKQKQ